MGVVAALIAGGVGLAAAGAESGQAAAASHAAKKAQRRSQQKALQFGLHNRQLIDQYAGLERGELQKGLEASLQGFDTGKTEVGRFGRASKQRVVDSEQQIEAQIAQTLQNTGFGQNASLSANAQRGIRSDTQRSLSNIDQGLSQMFADLSVGRGQAESFGRAQIGQSFARQGQEQVQVNRDLSAAFGAGQSYAPAPGGAPLDLGGIASLFGAFQKPGGDANASAAVGKSSPSSGGGLDLGSILGLLGMGGK